MRRKREELQACLACLTRVLAKPRFSKKAIKVFIFSRVNRQLVLNHNRWVFGDYWVVIRLIQPAIQDVCNIPSLNHARLRALLRNNALVLIDHGTISIPNTLDKCLIIQASLDMFLESERRLIVTGDRSLHHQ